MDAGPLAVRIVVHAHEVFLEGVIDHRRAGRIPIRFRQARVYFHQAMRNRPIQSLLVLGIFLLHGADAHAQATARAIVQEHMAAKSVPGIAFLIARDGKVLDEGYYGKANVEVGAAVTDSSVFAIASMSKTYTAAAILLMAERGLLHLDDPVTKYLPEAPEHWKRITIKHLLMHASGLIEDWELHDWNGSNAMFLRTQTEEEFLRIHFDMELVFEPGTDTRYASGPFILGVIIGRVTGLSYEAFLQEHILGPLSLRETYVDHPYKIIPNRVSGYFNYDPEVVAGPVDGIGNGILMAPVAYGRGDAGIRTTTHDLLRFYDALFSSELLSERSKDLMFTPAKLDNGDFAPFGAGWMNWPLGGMAISEHSGGFRTGFSSQALVVPEDRFVVIVLTNLRGGASFALAQALAAIHYPELEPLSRREPTKDPDPKATQAHLAFFRKMLSEKDPAHVHEAFPVAYYHDNLLKALSGTSSLTYLGEKNVGNEGMRFFGVAIHRLRYYRLNGERTWYTTAYLDASGKLVFIDHPETQ